MLLESATRCEERIPGPLARGQDDGECRRAGATERERGAGGGAVVAVHGIGVARGRCDPDGAISTHSSSTSGAITPSATASATPPATPACAAPQVSRACASPAIAALLTNSVGGFTGSDGCSTTTNGAWPADRRGQRRRPGRARRPVARPQHGVDVGRLRALADEGLADLERAPSGSGAPVADLLEQLGSSTVSGFVS
jgi:hypothetical protein